MKSVKQTTKCGITGYDEKQGWGRFDLLRQNFGPLKCL